MSNERAPVKEYQKLIIQLAAYYEKDLSDVQIRLYADSLREALDFDEALIAIKGYYSDPENEFFPRPIIKVVRYATQGSSDDSEAREAAARIVAAVKKFGYCGRAAAQLYIGELGWRVVELQGDWVAICETMTPQNQTSMQAQFRDLAKSQLERARAGRLDHGPALPGPITKTHSQLQSMAKAIAERKQLK